MGKIIAENPLSPWLGGFSYFKVLKVYEDMFVFLVPQ